MTQVHSSHLIKPMPSNSMILLKLP